jgi:hypothetical protein
MSLERTWALVLAGVILIAISMWTPQSSLRLPPLFVHAAAAPSTTTVIDTDNRPLPTHNDDWAEPRVDLNGNEIDDAVTDYRIDGQGELYERHAPDTALLRLSAPQL